MVKGQFINETDSLTASRKLLSHVTKHVQDLYNLSMQNSDLESTNLPQKHVTNENFFGGLSKCSRHMLDFGFWIIDL